MSVFTLSIDAQECGIVSLEDLKIEGKSYPAKLLTVNGRYTGVDNNYLDHDQNNLQFEVGQHYLTIGWKQKLNYIVKHLKLSVEANHKHEIHPVNRGNIDSLIIEFKNEQNNQCNVQSGFIEASHSPYVDEQLLPPVLEQRLQQLILSLTEHHEYSIAPIENLVPATVYDYFGVVLDNHLLVETKGFKVIAVLPFSLASKLSLVSGDIVVGLGDKRFTKKDVDSNRALFNYLRELTVGDNITMNVIRDNVDVRLSQRYTLSLVPQTYYQIHEQKELEKDLNSIIKETELSKNIAFQYMQLMLEIDKYYAGRNISTNVRLTRSQKMLNSYGLKGVLTELKDTVQLKVSEVLFGSPAEKVGLIEGDILVKINGQPISNAINDFQKVINELQPNQIYNIEIIRKNETLTLSGIFNHTIVPSFSIELALSGSHLFEQWANNTKKSFKNINDAFATMYKRKLRKYDNGRESYHDRSNISSWKVDHGGKGQRKSTTTQKSN